MVLLPWKLVVDVSKRNLSEVDRNLMNGVSVDGE